MLTPSDKQVIAEYMGWSFDDDANLYFYTNKKIELCIAHFDLNNAALCVEKMRNTPSDEFISDWHDFFYFACPANVVTAQVTEFFMNADNFFTAMAEWLRQK